MREQYGSQRKLSTEIGFSAIQIEDNERKLVRSSNGTVTPAASDAALKRIAELNTDAFTDPTGTTARNLRLKGLPLRTFGEGNFTAPERAQQLQNLFRGMSDSKVNAAAKSFGLDTDTARAMKNSKGDLSQITDHSQAEVASRFQAQDNLSKLNDATAQASENFRELSNELGEQLLPLFTSLATAMSGATGGLARRLGGSQDDLSQQQAKEASAHGFWEKAKIAFGFDDTNATKNTTDDSGSKRRHQEDAAKVEAVLDRQNADRIAQEATNAAKTQTLADQNAAAVSMFAASVATFSGAVDLNQAIAAWAGEAGRGMGLKGPDGVAMPRPGSANTEGSARGTAVADLSGYAPFIAAASAKNSVPVSIIQGIINTESSGVANKTSPTGNMGLMQISPAIAKKYGAKDPMDPASNINAGVAEYRWFLDKAKGNHALALQMYNGGLDPSKYGPQNAAYPGKVLDAAAAYSTYASVGGYGRSSINRNLLVSQFASGLGVSQLQVAQGMVNKGDLQRESDLLNAGYRNKLGQLLNEAHNPYLSVNASAQMIREANQQARGLDYLQQYGPDIIAKGREGGRALTAGATPAGSTIDRMAVQINVNGAGDPHAVALEIQKVLGQHINDIHNASSNTITR